MWSARATLALFFLAAGLPNVLAQAQDPTFFSCAVPAYHTSTGTSPLPAGANPVTDAPSCAASCYTATASPYSSYIYSTGSCRCSTRSPLNQEYISGNDRGCGAGNPEVTITHTSFDIQQCYFNYSGMTILASGEDTDVMSIFTKCAQYQYINVFTAAANFYQYNCGTGRPVVPTSEERACGPATNHLYFHNAAAQASLLNRKRAREQLALEAKVAKSDCPNGMLACQVSSTPGMGFECIEPTSELESCGGCVYGLYSQMGQRFNTTVDATGVNCGAIPNALFGSEACAAGQCEFKCRRGYKREALSCVPTAAKLHRRK